MKAKPENIIDIPVFNTSEQYDSNRERADASNMEHCPCCGKAIKNPKYYINSIYGGCMYPKFDKKEYDDAWVMAVGSECRKKLPTGYVMKKDEL